MVMTALVIVFIILLIANCSVCIYNSRQKKYIYDAEEFFNGAKMLPDGVSASLGSIQTSTDRNYVGARVFDTGIPGTIGLTSHNKSYVSFKDNDNYVNPVVRENENTAVNNELDDSAEQAISSIFPAASQKISAGKTSYDDSTGSIIEHEISMEGVRANTPHKKRNTHGKHLDMAYRTLRDGYSTRRPHEE